jgi:NMD protein affecting ribosome stability and mRNA decay
MICSLCGEEIKDNLIGGMCQDCINGFNSSSNVVKSNKMEEDNENIMKNNCVICNNLTNQENCICIQCLSEYHSKIKEYLEKYPNMSYLEAVGNKNIPVPRKVFYEFVEAKIIKIK